MTSPCNTDINVIGNVSCTKNVNKINDIVTRTSREKKSSNLRASDVIKFDKPCL